MNEFLSRADDKSMYSAMLGELHEDAQRAVPAIAQALRFLDDADVGPALLAALEPHSIDVHGSPEGQMESILDNLKERADQRTNLM